MTRRAGRLRTMKLMVSGMKVPRADAGQKLRGEESLEVRRERPEQAGDEKQRNAPQQNAAHAENRAEVRAGDADQHLTDAEARRHPGAFIEAEMKAAAQIGEAEARDAAAERRHDRAEQHAQNPDIGAEVSALRRG